MFEIRLKGDKSFMCGGEETILGAALKDGFVLEHSCLSGRCRSCLARCIEGETRDLNEDLVLSSEEKAKGLILTCCATPLSNVSLDSEDLGEFHLQQSRTIPAKIDSLVKVSDNVIRVILRLPPNSNFKYRSGQYVNIIRGSIKRSYSISNIQAEIDNKLVFLIKNYPEGIMSDYWFNQAKLNDLLRIEGPLGTFFYRPKEEIENVVLLATGTGIAPMIAMLEDFKANPKCIENKRIILLWGARIVEDTFIPNSYFESLEFLDYQRVLSRENIQADSVKKYVQNVLVEKLNNLTLTQVYACGSNEMINSAQQFLTNNGLSEKEFFSDAFICTE